MAINVMARVIYPIPRWATGVGSGMVSKWWHEYQVVVEVVGVLDTSVAKMSGGDVDVEPYLDSRNTKGYGTATQILKGQSGNMCRSAKRVSNGGGMRKL